jgi:solute carrier family 35 protein E1
MDQGMQRSPTLYTPQHPLRAQVAFLALNEVAPVTHAVTNTVKRVVIILVSILVFRTPVSALGALGSAMAIGGATAYSLASAKYKKK